MLEKCGKILVSCSISQRGAAILLFTCGSSQVMMHVIKNDNAGKMAENVSYALKNAIQSSPIGNV
ncbi:hypothetical protein T10_1456 [Trichinella papuae]|uniref:Uncharacterized protein n=1 Tax=Trichinella papuae TaxID=268474 RepID=A0A0V1MIQ7_9BILA|nr:hypothetical protein T10_1456 [Trichinella papuae]